ncbi:hypothetical protein [Paraburkholderia sp. JHI869]|uniref:hypothetical protein n=1 Tax=Paraburkholderia sp. JHI869 TaxID=3112959 RepID=UPI00317A5332
MEKIEMVRRSAGDMENYFLELVASRLPLSIAREKLEHLWDAVNSAVSSVISSLEGYGYKRT